MLIGHFASLRIDAGDSARNAALLPVVAFGLLLPRQIALAQHHDLPGDRRFAFGAHQHPVAFPHLIEPEFGGPGQVLLAGRYSKQSRVGLQRDPLLSSAVQLNQQCGWRSLYLRHGSDVPFRRLCGEGGHGDEPDCRA